MKGKWIVCGRCDGEGKHVNPAIDGQGGLTAEDFDQMGPEFEDDYFSGVYDVICTECKGQRVVKSRFAKSEEELDEERWNREWLAEIQREERMLGTWY